MSTLREAAQAVGAWAVECDGALVDVYLTETAAKLVAENMHEANRGRDFVWRVVPLVRRTHPPRDEWRPEDGRRYRYLKSFCSPMGLDANNNHSWTCRINPSRMRGASVDEALDAAMERDGWRDVTPPTTEGE